MKRSSCSFFLQPPLSVTMVFAIFLYCLVVSEELTARDTDLIAKSTITKLIEDKNYDSLNRYLDHIDRRWAKEGSLQCFDTLWTISQAILETDDLSPEGKKFLLDVLKRALEKDAAGEVKNYELLTRQAEFLPSLMRKDVFRDEPTFRKLRCSILASFMAKINAVRDPNFVPVKTYTKVPPIIVEGLKPGDIPIGGTTDPKTIKNPELRKKYEKRIQENQKNIDINQEKLASNSLYSRYEPEMKDFFASSYRNDPKNVTELKHCLHDGKFSKEFTEDVLKRIKEKQRANQ